MPYRFAEIAAGPLAKIIEGLNLPVSIRPSGKDDRRLLSVIDPALAAGLQAAWAILPITSKIGDNYAPDFQSVSDWLPGMVTLFQRRTQFHASASAEVSALWTSLSAPLKTAVIGDIGLDLDLGIQTRAEWRADAASWIAVQRPGAGRTLRLTLSANRESARSIGVTATAAAGLDQATRTAAAAILRQHRTQLLQQLQQGSTGLLRRLPSPIARLRAFLDEWLALPAAVQDEQWRNPVDPILEGIKASIEDHVAGTLQQADQLTARLEYAAMRTLETKLEASLSALFQTTENHVAVFDASFDFDANPALENRFRQAMAGNLVPLLDQPVKGVTLHSCAIADDLNRRRTFAWRLPFLTGYMDSRERLHTAMNALDDATGRTVKGYAKAESERRTRHAASLLSIEGAFAARLGNGVTVHDPASCRARFEFSCPVTSPAALERLLNVYHAGPVNAAASLCHLTVSLPPESLAHWLEPQDSGEVSRRLQTAWRLLLPASVDLAPLHWRVAAPLLVWASLPVSTAAARNGAGLQINRPGPMYWDWADSQLVHAMVWNPRTRAALETHLAGSGYNASPDDLRRELAQPVGAAVFRSLLSTEASLVDRVTSMLKRRAAQAGTPAEAMRDLSFLLGGLTQVFHAKLTSIYGPETARVLGPLLLTAAAPVRPEVTVAWT